MSARPELRVRPSITWRFGHPPAAPDATRSLAVALLPLRSRAASGIHGSGTPNHQLISGRTLRARGIFASALAAAAGWLIEPAEPAAAEGSSGPLEARPVVAVVGLSPRCGATTVARGLGAELAARDSGGACVVSSAGPAGPCALGLPAAARLARTLSPLAGAGARAWGRLCLVEPHEPVGVAEATRHLAPLVLDVEDRAGASAAAALADHVLLVGLPTTEPALAAVIAESLRRVGCEPVAVLNRTGAGAERWEGRGAVELPESRMGARLALAGREPRGRLGRAVAELADCCEGHR